MNLDLTTDIGDTYSWSGPNGFVSTDEDPVINNMLEVNEGVYTVIVTDTPTGCTSSCSVSVTVNPESELQYSIGFPDM